jgi:hypothetical protein
MSRPEVGRARAFLQRADANLAAVRAMEALDEVPDEIVGFHGQQAAERGNVAMIPVMDATTIDREFEQLQVEFQDVAKTVQSLAAKMQAAEKAGDANAAEWLGDLKQVAQDVDDEQTQVKALLLAVHDFIGGVAQAQQGSAAPAAEEKPPLFAPGHEPSGEGEGTQPSGPQRHGMLGGMLGGMMGGGMMGGGMFGGYYGGGFGRAMEMGMAMNLGANLIGSIFR